jgi:MFS family permease
VTLAPRRAYALAAGVVGLMLFSSVVPSPLYATYRGLWGFSPVVLTLVYATYAFGVLTTLLLAGRLSDEIGRRPVLMVGLTGLMLAALLFMLAGSVAWLFVARGLQGLATGLVVASAGATLLDLHPRRDAAGVGLTNGVASTIGMGLGVLVSATLVQYLPAPRVLPYVVLFVLFAVAFTGVALMAEPVPHRSRPRLTPQRPSVPAAVRRPFVLAALGVTSSWSVNGLFLALGPRLAADLWHTTNVLVGGIAFVALATCAATAQFVFARTRPWLGAAAGSAALAAGMLLIALAAATGSPALFLIGAMVNGAGFGVSFLGALRALSAAIAPGERAQVMAAFYLVAYLALSVPAILAGIAVVPLGIATTFELFGCVVAALALVVAVQAWRTRPTVAPIEG